MVRCDRDKAYILLQARPEPVKDSSDSPGRVRAAAACDEEEAVVISGGDSRQYNARGIAQKKIL